MLVGSTSLGRVNSGRVNSGRVTSGRVTFSQFASWSGRVTSWSSYLLVELPLEYVALRSGYL
jgi:hypothetical protein